MATVALKRTAAAGLVVSGIGTAVVLAFVFPGAHGGCCSRSCPGGVRDGSIGPDPIVELGRPSWYERCGIVNQRLLALSAVGLGLLLSQRNQSAEGRFRYWTTGPVWIRAPQEAVFAGECPQHGPKSCSEATRQHVGVDRPLPGRGGSITLWATACRLQAWVKRNVHKGQAQDHSMEEAGVFVDSPHGGTGAGRRLYRRHQRIPISRR